METHQQTPETPGVNISIRPLREGDLVVARHIFHLAFGTFLGLPDPMMFFADRDYVRTRWLADPAAAFGAEVEGQIVGSNFAAKWGSVGFFGPLTVRPDFWDKGIAKRLLEPTMELFTEWRIKHAGLFTFAQSPKHIGLYQKFGFWPRFLTAIMSKSVEKVESMSQWTRFSRMPESEQRECLSACREVTDSIYEGLDLEREIWAVNTQGLGDTVLLWDGAKLVALAVCHYGRDTEAGEGTCYVKFGAVRRGITKAGQVFDQLLGVCEALATAQGLTRIEAGVNLGRDRAYGKMIARGFRTDLQGVSMHRPNKPGYNLPGTYVIDDWR